MKVIIFCEALNNRAGIERMTIQLAELLSEIYETYICTIDSYDINNLPYPLPSNVKITTLGSKFGSSLSKSDFLNLTNIFKFRRLCKKLKPTVVITVATPLIRISAPALIGLKIKNIGWEHFNVFAGSKIGTIFKLTASWFVNTTVVLTKKDEHDYKKFLSPRVITIPNFTTISSGETAKCENKVLLAVGRHSIQKGFDLLLKAWALSKHEGWTLRIVGDGELKAENIKLAEKLGILDSVKFEKSTPNIKKEFLNASCFVLSSRFEGLVMVLIEAKMLGLPSICFDCPNSPREVIRDNIDGWLVKSESIEELAKEISIRTSDLSKLREAGASARRDAERRFSRNAIRSEWINLLESFQ